MSKISSQFIASLVSRSPTNGSVRLSEAIFKVWKANISGYSDEQILEEAELRQKYVFGDLIDIRTKQEDLGIKPSFTIQEDEGMYFYFCSPSLETPILNKIIAQDSGQFEILCGEILKKFGAKVDIISGARDGGVDFIGYDLPLGCIKLETTIANQLLVMGQAKRHKDDLITETMLRCFVGAAMKKRYDLLVERKYNTKYMQPTIYAYWTTSDFHADAQRYAQQTGVWALSGIHIAQLVIKLGLENFDFNITSGN